MKNLGDVIAGATLYFCFSTQKGDGTPVAMAGSPALAVYKDDDVAQSVAGITLTQAFDGVTGLANVKIILSDAFYATAHDYSVQFTAGTVDGISLVGKTLACFSIENRFTNVQKISGDATAADNAELMFDGTGYAGGTTKLDVNAVTLDTQGVDAIWDAATIDMIAIGSIGKKLNDDDAAVAILGKLAGITVLANWLRGLFRKDAMDVTAKSEVGGTFDETTDSLQGIRDTEPLGTAMRGTDSAALAATALSNAVWTSAKAGYLTGAVALEATLTAMKGAGWTDENLKSIYDLLVSGAGLGNGAIEWTYTVSLGGDPYEGAVVEVYSDSLYADFVARGVTNTLGVITFNLDAGTYYLKVFVPGQPMATDTEVVS